MAKKQDSTALAPREENTALAALGIASDVPDFMAKATTGTEDIGRDDVNLPRLAIAQSLSPQLKRGDAKQIVGLEVGQMFNNLTGDVLGDGPLYAIVVKRGKRGVLFRPRTEGGGVLDPFLKLDDPRLQFGPNGEQPVATLFHEFTIMTLPLDNPPQILVVSLKASGIKVAKNWNSLIKLRNRELFAGVYELRSVEEKAAQGDFYNLSVKNAGWISDPKVYEMAKQAFEAFKDIRITTDVDGEHDATGADDAVQVPREKIPF